MNGKENVRTSMLVIAVAVVVLSFAGCSNSEIPDVGLPEGTGEGLRGAEAVDRARQALPHVGRDDWKLAFLSNTGVPQQIVAQGIDSPEAALMTSEGLAGQWIVEFYREEPEPFTEGDNEGIRYPFSYVTVTSNEVGFREYENGLAVRVPLATLSDEAVSALDTAFELASASVDARYDLSSAASSVDSDGTVEWLFRFYDLESGDIVDAVAVSGDGLEILLWD